MVVSFRELTVSINDLRVASSRELLARLRDGKASALEALLGRHVRPLTRWAHGRLPRWARRIADTADLVQDALLQTLRNLDAFEPRGAGALRAYLRRAVDNRINDEYRSVARRGRIEPLDESLADDRYSPLEFAVAAETEARYRAALTQLCADDRRLVVAHVELGYSHNQLALLTGRRRTDSARVALHRALARLAAEMGHV